jgi:uncharacterized repeat protein (TIGR01451 family)
MKTSLFTLLTTAVTSVLVIFSMVPSLSSVTTLAAGGAYNGQPIQTDYINPVLSGSNIISQEPPTLNYFPFISGSPRSYSALATENIYLQMYYSNTGSGTICDPRMNVKVDKVSDTQYRVSSTLTGSDATSVTSGSKGGDLTLNIPATSQLTIVGKSTRHFPAAQVNFPSGINTKSPDAVVPDNSANGVTSNPLYSTFAGKTIPTSNGMSLLGNGNQSGGCLVNGTNSYGYVFSQILVSPKPTTPTPTNQPPSLTGQEITIVRGSTGSFQVYTCSDVDNNVPCSYTINSIPPFCTNNATTRVITCQTNANTPVKSTFTITPKDSLGLSGSPATFIVNVIEPNSPALAVDKNCKKKGTQDDCAKLNLGKGDLITYTINVKSVGASVAKNVKVVDDYDEKKLTAVTNLTPQGQINNETGTINVGLGDINAGDTKTITYDAKIKDEVANADKIINTVKATSDNTPEATASTEFVVALPGQPNLSPSEKLCFKKGTDTSCDDIDLTVGDLITYKILVKNTGTGAAYNVNVTDTYDKQKLVEIANANASGKIDAAAGTVVWQVGTVNPSETKELTFDAKIASTVKNADEIKNVAIVKADNYPDQRLENIFQVLVNIPVGTSVPRTGGAILWILGLLSVVGGGAYWYYKKNGKLGKFFVPSRTKEDDGK